MSTTIVSIPTLEGDLVVELFTSHAPRTCKYFLDILTNNNNNNQQQHTSNFAFSHRDNLKATCSLISATSKNSSTCQYFFADELQQSDKNDSLKFTGAGIIGVACEPNLESNAFFVTLAPMMNNTNNSNNNDVSSTSIVVGRVLQGMNTVVRYLVTAKCDANGRNFINPLGILRSAKVFANQELPPRPNIVAGNTVKRKSNSSQPEATSKKSSLLDSMFGGNDADDDDIY